MRCKACDSLLGRGGDFVYCRKCINASQDVDIHLDSLYYENHTKYKNDLKLQVFLSEYERKEVLNQE